MNIHGVCLGVSQMLIVPEDKAFALNRVHFWLAVLKDVILLRFLGERKKLFRLGVLCKHVLLNCFANPNPKRKLTFKCFRKELEQKREKSDFQLLETQRLLEQEKITR